MSWSIPEWKNITKQQFENMNPDQMHNFLKQAYSSAARELPEGPEKTLTLKVGRLCIQSEGLRRKYEAASDDDERDDIIKKIEENVSEAISSMLKILVLRQSKKIQEELVEIEESDTYEDPWAADWHSNVKVNTTIKKDNINKDEYNPWEEKG